MVSVSDILGAIDASTLISTIPPGPILCGSPFIGTLDKLLQFIQSNPNVLLFFWYQGKKILIGITNEDLKCYDISKMPDKFFFDARNLDTINISTVGMFEKHPDTLKLATRTIVVLSPGNIITLFNAKCLCVSNKGKGQYFDFVAWVYNGKLCGQLTYSKQNVESFIHSGDNLKSNHYKL